MSELALPWYVARELTCTSGSIEVDDERRSPPGPFENKKHQETRHGCVHPDGERRAAQKVSSLLFIDVYLLFTFYNPTA